MNDEYRYIDAAVDYLRRDDFSPVVGIILGTGLGGLAEKIDVDREIDYADIPHFPVSTVESHHGHLLLGHLEGTPVIAMQGRFHVYEGYSALELVRPVRVMQQLGVKTMLISNACGALNPDFRKGDLMLMKDHINLLGVNPLRGENLERFGIRFPDMSDAYSTRLRKLAHKIALDAGVSVQEGVYVAVAGPNLETAAEYRFLRTIGADVVGMSTIPEVIAAVQAGMDVFGISVITDECFPDALKPVALSEILAVADSAQPDLTRIMTGIVQELRSAL
jgi:purine-nucleoside phosphorylase